ncbi:MAG: hypothetical protein JSV84_00370, partial [Gemmatimonadota bacterium]
MVKKVSILLAAVLLVAGSAVAQYDYRAQCYPTCWDTCCINHDLDGDPEDFLVPSPTPQNDWYAVGFYNPCGRARLTSVSFQFYDPGAIEMRIYLGYDGFGGTPGMPCPPCEKLDPGPLPSGPMSPPLFAAIGTGEFIGNWEWETVDVDEYCVIIPAKTCFYVVWAMRSFNGLKPRILADAGHEESNSWIYDGGVGGPGQWKCYPGYEYMVEVCLDYVPDCVEIHEPDITWSHKYRGIYPCISDDYEVQAIFHHMHDCDESLGFEVTFSEAPWGLFTLPEGWPLTFPHCSKMASVPAGGADTLICECSYHHNVDMHNWWARNIFIAWGAKTWSSEPIAGECLADTMRYARRCRMTIWPDGPWSKQPVRWGLAPITIPVWNDHPVPMEVELQVEMPEELIYQGWRADLSETRIGLGPGPAPGPPGSTRDVYLTVWPDGAEPTMPVVIKVKAFKCTGEWGEVEIEFMPYPKHFYVGPDGRPIQPVDVRNIQWSPRYPCENMPYDVWVTVVNMGPNSAYPKISFGLAPWGFFFPVFEEWGDTYQPAVFDTVLWGGIGGFALQKVAPYHYQTPWFQYEDLGCNYYQQYERNIVIDYPVIRYHCPDPDFPENWTVADSTTEYLRDCERWLWPKHRWLDEEHPWAPVVFPIPVYNEEPYYDCITLSIDPLFGYPPGWDVSLDETHFCLPPGGSAVANLSVVPRGPVPPPGLPAHVYVGAKKAFYSPDAECERDYEEVDIKFMPFTGMCIRDTSGIKVGYKYSETCSGDDTIYPTLLPGDQVSIGLMLD